MGQTRSRWLGAAVAFGAAALLALGGVVPASAVDAPKAVTPSMVPGPTWGTDNTNGGSTSIRGVAGLGSVLQLEVSATNQNASLFHRWAADARPSEHGVTIRELLERGSYTARGLNVNLQLPILFAPKDPAKYGPDGTEAPCTRAAGAADPRNVCFATLKFEPGALGASVDRWQSFRPLDYADQAFGAGPGWWPTRNVGPYGNAVAKRAGLNQLLDAVDSYEVTGLGVAVGSGVQGTAYVSDLSFGGDAYRFQPDSAPVPAEQVPASTAKLAELIADPSANAEQLAPEQVSDLSADDLSQVATTEDLSGTVEWSGGDGLVDIFLFSTPQVIARGVPVVQGRIDFSIPSAELAKLSGGHDVVLIGQTSGALRALPFTLAKADQPGEGGSGVEGGSGSVSGGTADSSAGAAGSGDQSGRGQSAAGANASAQSDARTGADGGSGIGANGAKELARTGGLDANLLGGAGVLVLITAGAAVLAARRRVPTV